MLRRLSVGRGDTVLAIDYPGGRAEATFEDLVRMLPAEVGVVEALPPQGAPWTVSPRDYIGEWITDIGSDSLEVGAVLGYCAGGLLACCLADTLADQGRAADHVIVLDATEINNAGLHAMVWQSFDGLRWAMSEPDRDALDSVLDACAGRASEELLGTAWQTYVEVSVATLGQDLSESYLRSLHQEYSQWLAYMAVASACHLRTRHTPLTAVTSTQFASDADPGNHVTVDVDHAALLRSPETAMIVAEILTRE